MRIFPFKRPEGKQTVVVLNSEEFSQMIAEAIATKLGIDLGNENTSFYFSNDAHHYTLESGKTKDYGCSISFLERNNDNA